MAKTKIQHCKKCNGFTEHTYVGKLKEAEDASFNRIATIMTLGGYQVVKRLLNDSQKCFKCSECRNICKER